MPSTRALRFTAYGSVVVGAVVLILAGVLGWVVIPNIIEGKVKEETRLVEESDTYEKWLDIPVPIYLRVWFFHVKNIEDFECSSDWSAIPDMEEVGPFVWRESRVKYDIRDGPDDTVFYRQNITYVFDQEQSGNLTEDMTLNLINIPFAAAVTLLDIYNVTRILAQPVLNSLLKSNESIFARDVSVKDVVFTGVDLKPVYKTVETVANALGIPLPDELKNGQFAVYREKNATNAEGVWQVNRGVQDSSLFSIIKSVNDGKTSLEPWWYDHCAMINGTDGTMFPPFIEKSDRLYVYASEICRSIFLDFDSEVEYEGIPGYRFILPTELFTDPNVYEPNQCFCMDVMSPLNSSCNFNGMGRLFSCKAQVPITISKPHFLDADEWVVERARSFGLSPRREDHDTFLDIEPTTGFPLRIHKRLQLGVEIQPYKSVAVPPFNTIPHIIYPIFWVDESAELNEELVDEIKTKLIKPLNYVKIGKWTLVGIGIFLTLSGVMYSAFSWNKS